MDPQSQWVIAALCALIVAASLWLFVRPRVRNRRLDAQPFPAEWEAIVQQWLPCYRRMPEDVKDALRNRIKHFLANKRFVGCAGQQIDDTIRLSIAAQACLLILNRPGDYYADLRWILVYPNEFVVERHRPDESGVVSDGRHVLAGESWSDGRVILAWSSIQQGIADFTDGFNVVLHEFAHQLDHQSGATNGAPLLKSAADYQQWAAVFSEEFARLQAVARRANVGPGTPARFADEVLDLYGASNPAEFFAVATESFFEQSSALAQRHPHLYEQLQRYYEVDPRQWE